MLKKKAGVFFILFITHSCVSFAQDSNALLDKIIVLKSKKAFEGYYTLGSDNLQSLPFDAPVEALSVTFLNLQSRSPNSSIQADFSLRGSNFQGVRVLLNGRRINDPQTGHHNADIPLTKEDLSSIDILSGVSPLGFGPDAIGGAVNFITKRPKEKKAVLELSGGEFGSYGQLFSLSDKIRGLGLRFSVENKESDGFSKDTDFKKFTANMASSLDMPLGSFDLDFGYQEKEFGAYDFYTPGLGYPSKEWTKTYLLSSGFNLDKDGLIIKPSFIWRRHFDKFMLDKTQARSSFISHHRTDVYTPSIYLSRESQLIGRIGLGLEYSQESITSTTLGRHNRAQRSVFIDNDYSFSDRLSLASILRFEDYDGRDLSYTGSIRLSYEAVKDHLFHLGVSRAIRIPSFTELYYNDPTTVGASDLSCEKSLTYEAGHSYKHGKFSLVSVFFLRGEDNFIDWVKANPLQSKWEARNIASSQVIGIEESLQYTFNELVNLRLNYAYTSRSKDDKGYIYKYGENYARHLTSLISVFNLDFGVQEFGLTYKKPPSRSGWLLLHAKFNYNLNKNTKFFLSATNIFNVEYQEIAGIPSPGRWVEGGIRVEW
ncbi:MAG: TonB-dependent receptor [Candidatus Omnitrophota bacterium]|jgi:iron complex outermembrane receptor protein|nr:TonB-dependent receptor [Candidatus Omnitrophota bacterium]